MAEERIGDVMLKEVRLSFPVLAEPKNTFDPSKPRYGASAIMQRGGPVHKALSNAMKKVALAKWGEEKGLKILKECAKNIQRCCLQESKVDPENEMVLSAYNDARHPPLLLHANKAIMRDIAEIERVLYPGCYVNMKINLWAQDNQNGKAIRAALLAVQFAKNGERFGAGSGASLDEFDVIEGAEDVDLPSEKEDDDDDDFL